MIGRLIVAGVVAVLILLECLVAFMLIPSPEAVATAAKRKIAQEKEKIEQEQDAGVPENEGESAVEVDLGKFNIALHQHSSNSTLFINFVLVGTVKDEEKSAFDTLFENNKHRLRERILMEIRNSELTDITEPGLGLIKRRILEKSNTLLGKPLLTAVVFSEFSFHEQ